ncbi:hypothetical protein HPB50_027881 [Hyalomma asiaticum]|nr:hypothetical protein HPB50_027881 [Hyalomma asiaticum]
MNFIQLSSTFIFSTLWIGAFVEQFVETYAPTWKTPILSQEKLQNEIDLWTFAGPERAFSSRDKLEPKTDLWTAAGLVKDLSLDAAPVALLKVAYRSVPVIINGTLTPEQTAEAPAVSLVGAINCIPPFALLMLDPDAPSRENPSLRNWLHWMVINAHTTRRLDKGQQVVRYNGPTPPEGTGPHRYVFLAFCQGGKRAKAIKLKPWVRKKFNLKKFRRRIGDTVPFGGTFFYAENAGMLKTPPEPFSWPQAKL